MKLRRRIWLAAAICGACFFGFRSCNPVSASAVDSVRLTPAQTRALFGDTLTVTYFNGTDYVSTELTYLTSAAIINPDNPPNFGYASGMRDLFGALVDVDTRYVVYSASGISDLVEAAQYTVTLEPTVQFSNCQICNFVAGLSCSETWSVDPNANPQNYVQYLVNGNLMQNGVFLSGASPTASIYRTIPFDFLVGTGQYQQSRFFSLCPITYSSDTYSTINQFKFVRTGSMSNGSGIIRFILSCPTISVNTQTSPDSGQTGTDLTSTNIKLDTIIDILSQIAENTADDGNSGGGDGNESPAFDVPVFFDNKLLEIDPEFDFYFNVPVIFGGSDSGISSQGITNGGQVFLPDGENTPMIQADPTNGGVLAGTGSIFDMFNRLLKINPVISKLICIFLAGSIASWAIFEGRG